MKKNLSDERRREKNWTFPGKISFEPHLRVELAPVGLSDLFGRFNFYCDEDARV